MNVIRLNPPPPSALTPSVPAELDALVARALAKPVESRPSGALALSSDLRRIASTLDAREREIELPTRPAAAGRKRPRVAGGSGIVAVLMLLWYFSD